MFSNVGMLLIIFGNQSSGSQAQALDDLSWNEPYNINVNK